MILFVVSETLMMPVCFLSTSTRVIPTFTMETEERGQLPFLDVLLSKQSVSDRQGSFITSVYRKKTFTGLLTNYFSFTPFKYKLGLIKTLIDRAYKILDCEQSLSFPSVFLAFLRAIVELWSSEQRAAKPRDTRARRRFFFF